MSGAEIDARNRSGRDPKPPPHWLAGLDKQQHVVSDIGTTVSALQQLNNKQLAGAAWAQALRATATSPALVQANQDFQARSQAAGLTACRQFHLGA